MLSTDFAALPSGKRPAATTSFEEGRDQRETDAAPPNGDGASDVRHRDVRALADGSAAAPRPLFGM